MSEPDDYTISLARANLLGVPLFLLLTAALVGPYVAWKGPAAFLVGVRGFVDLRVFLGWIAAGTLAHEALHGLGWVWAGRTSFRSVKFGFHWKTVTPFAHFTDPIAAKAYRVGIALPGITLGLLPAAAGYAFDSPSAVLFGGIFLGAAAGDAMSLWATRAIPAATPVLDHPTRVGCIVHQHQESPP